MSGKILDDYFERLIQSIETTELSEFSKEIIRELKSLNRSDCNLLIQELKQGKFDDYHVNAYPCPRMELVDRLSVLGLHILAKKVIRGKI